VDVRIAGKTAAVLEQARIVHGDALQQRLDRALARVGAWPNVAR
jgi:hypothetical protein